MPSLFDWITNRFGGFPGRDRHDVAVTKISEKVKGFYNQQKPFRIYHGSTNTTRNATRSLSCSIDISGLNKVLRVSADKMTALVEPNVPMDALVAATLKKGLIPPVVMEFPGITAGGAFAGTGGESSSFRWGTFDRIVKGVEIILGNGDIVWASEEQRSDLFNGSAGAFGTLGVVTLLEVQLVPAKSQLVKLHYYPVHSANEAVARFREHCGPGTSHQWDYVDGIMFSMNAGVVTAGSLLPAGGQDSADAYAVTARYSRAIDNWYYSDVQAKLEARPEGWVDVVPIKDYLFRFTRWLLDSFMHTRSLFNMLHETDTMIYAVIQDLCIPAKKLDFFVAFTMISVKIWPLWLCPMRPNAGRGTFQLSCSTDEVKDDLKDDLWINVGLWGRAPSQNIQEIVKINRMLEGVVRGIGGYKWLYAQTFYTEEEFWGIYGKKDYDSLRAKYNASHLPDAYEKVRTVINTTGGNGSVSGGGWKSVWPLGAIVAFCGAITGFVSNEPLVILVWNILKLTR
ncbi:hypothetical protein KVR01_000979 [Diaporthe batatas]|uniref:uncharacterized protein n=1 Tax=Diaporthe batatas TaxID=748121 RepID=UPI001D04CFE6|nr:uncharacterized protein KVR01_000979 [Diaporthe batatas]KAG8170234.1 hypothetical protein KVR01_000979 [Diaporthe batatas]